MASSATATMSVVPGGPPVVVPVSGSGVVPGERIPLTGAQTYVVDLAMMPPAGCKVLMVSVDLLDDAGAPATAVVDALVTINGAQKSIPIAPGGGIELVNPTPTPTTAPIALTLVSTANAVAHVTAYG